MTILGYVVAAVVIFAAGACTTGPTYPMPTAPTATEPPAVAAPPVTPPAPALEFSLGASPSPGSAGSATHLSARTSAHAPTEPVQYVWTFGDGQTGTSADGRMSHTYAKAGRYAASVLATDATGRTGAASTTVHVDDRRDDDDPTPTPGPPTPAVPTLTVRLTCSTPVAPATTTYCNVAGSYGGTPLLSTAIVDGTWDWGTGTTETVAGPTAQHTFAQPGVWIIGVAVQATTVDGLKTGRATATVSTGAPTSLVLFTNSGTGNTVFTIPATVTRVRITGQYAGAMSNFVVTIGSALVVSEVIGTDQTPQSLDRTYLTSGGVTSITNSSGVTWTFTEVRP